MRQVLFVGVVLLQMFAVCAEDGVARVDDIEVRGNGRLTTHSVLSLLKTRVGDPYDSKVWNADWERLDDSGCFQIIRTTEPMPSGRGGYKLAIDLVEAPAISTLTVECEDPVLAAKVSAASAGFLGSLSTPAVRECILEAARRAGGKAAALKIDEESVEKRMIGGREVKCVYKVSLIVSIPSEGKK